MEPTTGYTKERVKALLPNMGNEFTVSDLVEVAYASVMAECQDVERLAVMIPDLVMESCRASAKSVISSGTSQGSKNMTKYITDTTHVFTEHEIEDSFIKNDNGSVIRFGAAKMDNLENFRLRKKSNIEKVMADYNEYKAALAIVKAPMLLNDWTMGEYLRRNGRVLSASSEAA